MYNTQRSAQRQNIARQRGFSLIELLVVATIIIVLSSIGFVAFSSVGQSARDGKRRADLEIVRQALVLHRSNTGGYPATTGELLAPNNDRYIAAITALVNGGYISQPTPEDPRNDETYRYILSSSATEFCLCAATEDDSKANSNGSCSFSGTTHYCVTNP